MKPEATGVATVEQRIRTLRGQAVLLDSDLALLYGVSTKALIQAVRRNRLRFPDDFMFVLTSVLRSSAAVSVNIEIMRAFVRLRRASVVSEKLMSVVVELAQRVDAHDSAIKSLIESIRRLVEPAPPRRKRPIGFVPIE